MNPEFTVRELNRTGLQKAEEIGAGFNTLFERIAECVLDKTELTVIRTKLTEAWAMTKHTLLAQPQYQASSAVGAGRG